MAHTYVSNYVHYIFSTKYHESVILPEIQTKLWPYMGGIARQNGMKAIEVGGTQDHVHILLSSPASMSISKAIQYIKGGSSKWLHDICPKHQHFSWQEGYGAFTVSMSLIDKARNYIKGQQEHHKKVTFEEEYISFLKKYKIDYDERYVFD